MKQRLIAKITTLLQHAPVVRNLARQKFVAQFIIGLLKSRNVQFCEVAQHLNDAVKPALADYAGRLRTVAWDRAALAAMLKEVLAAHKLKMPQLAMPLRLLLTGQLQTPSIDALVELFGRDTVLERLQRG